MNMTPQLAEAIFFGVAALGSLLLAAVVNLLFVYSVTKVCDFVPALKTAIVRGVQREHQIRRHKDALRRKYSAESRLLRAELDEIKRGSIVTTGAERTPGHE